MHRRIRFVFTFISTALLLASCASHSKDFIPNGSGLNLPPTDPAHIQVLNSVPRGMIIGTVLVDRAKGKNTQDIIAMAKEKAAAAGGDFIVWEDSLGTLPVATPTPGEGPPPSNTGEVGHATADIEAPPSEEMVEKTPQARFTVGIFIPEKNSGAPGQ